MSDLRDQITSYLKTHGASTPRAMLDKLGGKASTLSRTLALMKESGGLQFAGRTINRVYALPGQKIELPEPGPRKPGRAGKKKAARTPKKKRAARKPRRHAKRRAAQASPFLASITADQRLVMHEGEAAPRVYTPEQSLAIAEVVFANFTQ